MTFDWTLFGPPLTALAGGLCAGIVAASVMPSSRSEEAGVLKAGRIDDLSSTREDAVAALRALEQEAAKLPEEEYTRQRRELLERGAAALRELDEGAELTDSQTERIAALEAQRPALGDVAVNAAIAALKGKPARSGSPAWVGAAWTVTLVAAAGVLWWQLTGEAAPRQEMMGAAAPAPAPAPRPDHPMKATWQAKIDANPNDLEALNGLTEIAIGERDLGLAMELSGKALEVEPKDLDARTHRAVLQAAVGMSPMAFEILAEVRAEAPDFGKAWVYTGLLALDQKDYALAEEALSRAMVLEPDRAEFLASRVQMAREMSAATQDVLVAGHIEAPGIEINGNEILFVSLRDPAGGPPIAALRLPPELPTDIVVTRANMISMGGPPRPLPEQVVVTVRLDLDGNPMTKDGPAAEPVTIVPGTSDLVFVLSP